MRGDWNWHGLSAEQPSSAGLCIDENRQCVLYEEAVPIGKLASAMPRRLTPRWSERVEDKVPSSYTGARAAQLNR